LQRRADGGGHAGGDGWRARITCCSGPAAPRTPSWFERVHERSGHEVEAHAAGRGARSDVPLFFSCPPSTPTCLPLQLQDLSKGDISRKIRELTDGR
jgi:hypothetical protein